MDSLSKEERVQLALRAFKNGQFETKKAASLAFDVPETTLRRRIQGIASRSKRAYTCDGLVKLIYASAVPSLWLGILVFCHLAQRLSYMNASIKVTVTILAKSYHLQRNQHSQHGS